jgi:Tfp pilus assembly protein PilV
VQNERGTTLLETLVAILILTIGLIGLAQFVAYSSANDLRSHMRIEIPQIAEERLQLIRLQPFSALGPPVTIPAITVNTIKAPVLGVTPTETPDLVTGATGWQYKVWTYIYNPTISVNPDLRQVVVIVQSANSGFSSRDLHRFTEYRSKVSVGLYYNLNSKTP